MREVHVSGAQRQHHPVVRGISIETLDFLEWDTHLKVMVAVDPDWPVGVEASAHYDGVKISPAMVTPELFLRMAWVLAEEIGHCFLAETQGVPHGGEFLETLFQEMFACFVQCRMYVSAGWLSPEDLTTTSVPVSAPNAALGYHLGKHVAAAAIGSNANRRHLEAWLADESVDPMLKQLISTMQAELPFDAGPGPLARQLGAIYRDMPRTPA